MIDANGFEWAEWDKHVTKVPTSGPCWHCGAETQWVEINFQAYLCSKACNDAKWDEYAKAFRKSSE